MRLDLKRHERSFFFPLVPSPPSAIFCALLVVPVFIQGGYQEFVACGFGVLASAGLLVTCIRKLSRRQPSQGRKASLVAPFFFLLACTYLLSSLVKSPCLTSLAETGFWFAVAAVAGLASVLSSEERSGVLRCFCWAGVASAVLGVFIFCDVATPFGTMDDGRLQFFFQYANTSAVWFGAAALLSLLSGDARLAAASPLPLLAALLTQSGGGILSILVACAALCAYWWRAKRFGDILSAMCKVVAVAAAFMWLLAADGASGLLAPAALIAFCALSDRLDSKIEQLPRKRLVCLLVSAVVFLCAAVAALLMADRLSAASYHFIERFIHVVDGLALLASSPLFGLGPDQWQFAYPYIQSAQYHVIHAHCSYIQAAVDAGVVGLAFLVAALAVGMRRCWLRGEKAVVLVLGMLALHMLVDFDTQFATFSFLLAFLLAEPLGDGPSPEARENLPSSAKGPAAETATAASLGAPRPAKRLASGLGAGIVTGVCCLTLCLAGAFADLTKVTIEAASERGDYDQAARLYSESYLAWDDILSQQALMKAAYEAGEPDPVLRIYLESGVRSDWQALYVAVTLFEVGESEVASLVLVEEMELQPYNDALYQSAYAIFAKYGIHEAVVSRYNAAINNLNQLSQTGVAALLPDQKLLDIYL